MRIFIEWTVTSCSGLNTGVQRVVRNVVRHAPAVGLEMGIECIPVILRDGRFTSVHLAESGSATWHAGRFRIWANALYWKISHAFVARIPDPRVRDLLLANKHRPGLARLLVWLAMPAIRVSNILSRLGRARGSDDSELGVDHGDWLLLADGADQIDCAEAIGAFKLRGARVAAIVYDLLPVTEPQFFEPRSRQAFSDWIGWAVRSCDAYCCISGAVEAQLTRFLDSQCADLQLASKRIGSFPLGVELDADQLPAKIRTSLKGLFDREVFLTVGTLDPRKNHIGLLAACETAWQRGFGGALLIVGRVGWLCEEVVERMVALKAQGRPIFHFQDITDAELEFCYANARALIFPSFAEGFGLPIAEALARKLPVMASDIPVFREVGRGDVTYFDPHNSDELARLLLAFEERRSAGERGIRAERPWPAWRDSTAELIGLIASFGDSKGNTSRIDKT